MNIYNFDTSASLPTRTAVTVGMFDGVHLGHRHLLQLLLETARATGLKPVVVTFDRHPRQVLGLDVAQFRLLSTLEERLQLLRDEGVDDVVLVPFTREMAAVSACNFARQYLLTKLDMKALVLGYDNMFGSKQNDDFALLPRLAEENDVIIRTDTSVRWQGKEVSSTRIRRTLADGDTRAAAAMLGRCYAVTGVVTHGRSVGRRIGFPTANVLPSDADKALPADGVYGVVAQCDGRCYAAMANVGSQPTFGLVAPVLEVHLVDADVALYGQTLRVVFVERLRDIRRFDSVEALVAQLDADRCHVRQQAEAYLSEASSVPLYQPNISEK